MLLNLINIIFYLLFLLNFNLLKLKRLYASKIWIQNVVIILMTNIVATLVWPTGVPIRVGCLISYSPGIKKKKFKCKRDTLQLKPKPFKLLNFKV